MVETTSPQLRQQITSGKDVNLISRLIPYYIPADENDGNKKPDKRLLRSLPLRGEFIQAFGIYKNIIGQAYPERRQELDLYERDIIDIATKYPGKGFNEYHRQFSLMAASHLKYNNILMIGQYETILFFVTCLQTIENKLAPHAIVLCIYLDFVH